MSCWLNVKMHNNEEISFYSILYMLKIQNKNKNILFMENFIKVVWLFVHDIGDRFFWNCIEILLKNICNVYKTENIYTISKEFPHIKISGLIFGNKELFYYQEIYE